MGFFDFFKKKKPEVKVTFTTREYTQGELSQQREQEVGEIKKLACESIPDENGLRPHEIFMLSYAERYKTGENNFPMFWQYSFGVDDPQGLLTMLYNRGFIRIATAKESVEKLKVAELKELLSEFGISAKGKKADLILAIQENISEEELSEKIPVRFYIITETGEHELNSNEYVTYFGGSCKYGLTVWDMNKMIQGYPPKLYRDKIWANFNRILHDSAKLLQKDGDIYSFYLRNISVEYEMCDFLIEENRHIEDALRIWAEAAYYDIMVSAVKNYKMGLDTKKKIPYTNVSGFSETLNLVYKAKQVRTIQQNMDISNDELFQKLVSYFLKCPKIQYELIKQYNITKLKLPIQDIAGLVVATASESHDIANKIYDDIEKQIKNDRTSIFK